MSRPNRAVDLAPLALGEDDNAQLLTLANSRSLEHRPRAQIVLACAEGETNASIARRLGRLSQFTVGKWRRRYLTQGLEGIVHDETAPASPHP